MGNKSRFRQSFAADGSPAKNPKWVALRNVAAAHLPKHRTSWGGLRAPCAADLVHVLVAEVGVGKPTDKVHYRRALPVLWNSARAGPFRDTKPLNSQLESH